MFFLSPGVSTVSVKSHPVLPFGSVSEMLHLQQGTPKTRAHSLAPDRIPPARTSCYWARRRSWRRGTGESLTTGSPFRSSWLMARGLQMGRRYTTLCFLWPRCDLSTERGKRTENLVKKLTRVENLWGYGDLFETFWFVIKIELSLQVERQMRDTGEVKDLKET